MAPPKLHRAAGGGWVLAGTELYIHREGRGGWRITAGLTQCRWLSDQQFGSFTTRAQALRSLTAAMSLSAPPAITPVQLRRISAGHHVSLNGQWKVSRRGSLWQISGLSRRTRRYLGSMVMMESTLAQAAVTIRHMEDGINR